MSKGLRSKQTKQCEISFNIAKQEALDYINRGEEKPGCIVKEVNSVIGKGLFANKEYTAGEFIMEYAGELINRKEGLKREKCYPLEKGSYIYFFLFDSKKFCLDATNSTKHGRYANDAAPGDTQENAAMKCVSNKGRPHLALFAMRKIAAGEEVRYDYGVPNLPWRKKDDDVLQCEAEGQHHENTLLKKCSVLLKRVSGKVLNKIRKVESDVEEYMHVEVNESIEKTPVESDVEEYMHVEVNESIEKTPVESDVEEYMHVEVNESIEKTPVESDVEEYMHVEVNESIEKTPDTGNTCHECKVSFNLESSLHRHTQTCHPDESCIDFLNCGKCKSIFGDIQSFMDHKRFCQANGRKDQREKKTDVVAIMGSFHQSSPEIFQHSAAGTQCSSMCLAAIVAFSLKNVESWDSNFVDNVLKGGDKLHLEILKSKQWPYQRKESRLAVDELPQKFECQIGRHDVIANSEYQEPLFGFSSYIETFVLTSIINHPNQSFILRMYDFCIAILCSNQNQYSIFDSHAKNSEGIIDANGTAGLFNFRNPSEMVKYLKCTTTEKNVQIDLYPVTVQFMRTEVMEESVPCVENLTAALNQATESSHKSIPCRETESPEKEQNNRKIPNEAEKTQKKVRPKRPCPFCDKLASRLSDHIKRKHKNEESVVNALSLPKELRDREFQTFKKEGIFKVNSNLLSKEASPDFENLLHERRFVKSNSTVVCSLCKGFYSKRRIARHKKTCFRAENCTDYPTSFNVTLLRNDEEYSDKYRKEILEGFHENEVGKLIRNDAWIKQYGYLSYQNFEGTEKRAEKRKSLMSKLRRLGHLYLQFKKIMSEKHPNFAFTSCREMFKRDNILGIQSAINSITTTDNENVIKSGLKVSLRYLIADVCKVMRAYFLFTRQDEEAEEMSKFISVLQVYWPSFFATAEESVLKKRQSDLRRPSKLPKEEEIDRLIIFTKEVIKNLSSGAGYQILENNNYCELRNTVVCRLTLCNARRGGEPSRMTLTEWNDAFNDVWVDPTKINDVTDEDKKLLCEYKIAYIHASKVSKLVSLLIPEDCWKAMKILADPEIRRHADINVKNKFVFPSVKNSLTHVTGWVCVNNVCRKAGLKHCVTATGMRHYMSTAYARKSVSAAERELFFKHLGHSRRMNEDVYQTPLAIQTITTVGKFMSSIEGDGGSKFSVSDFQPGDQALESSNCSVSDFQPGDQAFESVKRKNQIDDSLLEEEIPRPSKKMKRIPTCTKERTFHGDSEFHYSDTESSDSEKFSPMKVEKTEEKDTRHTWLEHEDRAIDDFFQTEINEFSNVGNKGSLEGGN
ncbi:uncharacterized protein LOC125672892 isoform X3 [Ostrea edulis]|uniref:uncharacterized protein LOC125672892 isoform X3 n=1 Tax=Ostrea edulis TaxID=37623 RepID=UPI0024AFAE20|nr:uncharacterized protein LOC125672892 isoform X3 [Ostrea edulis]